LADGDKGRCEDDSMLRPELSPAFFLRRHSSTLERTHERGLRPLNILKSSSSNLLSATVGSNPSTALRLLTPPGSRMMSAARRAVNARASESLPPLSMSAVPFLRLAGLIPNRPLSVRHYARAFVRSLFGFRASVLDIAGAATA